MTKSRLFDELVGAWSLQSYTQKFDDGQPDAHPMQDQPQGLILYTRNGFMSAQLGPARRAFFASDIITDGSASELADAARNFIAYSGRFSCHDAESRVIHHVRVSLFPNWIGVDQVRAVQIEKDLLTLSTVAGQPGSRPGASQHLVWRRQEMEDG